MATQAWTQAEQHRERTDVPRALRAATAARIAHRAVAQHWRPRLLRTERERNTMEDAIVGGHSY